MKTTPCCKNGTRSKADMQKVSSFLKLINEPNRLKILCFLREEERCVCDIWKGLVIPQNLVSHHLKALKDFGIINSRQEGRKIFYSSDKAKLREYSSLINDFLTSNL